MSATKTKIPLKGAAASSTAAAKKSSSADDFSKKILLCAPHALQRTRVESFQNKTARRNFVRIDSRLCFAALLPDTPQPLYPEPRRAQGVGYLSSGAPFLLASQQVVDQCWGSKATSQQAVTMRYLGLAYSTLGAALLCGNADDCGAATRRNLHKVALASGIVNILVTADARRRGMNPAISDSITGSTLLLGAASAIAAFRKD